MKSTCIKSLVALAMCQSFAFAGGKDVYPEPENIVPGPAPAERPAFYINAKGGVNAPLSGKVHGGAKVSVPGFVLGLPLNSVPIVIEARDYQDIYDVLWNGALEFGYNFTPRLSAYVGGSYTTGNADRVQVGNAAGFPLNAEFDDYEDFGIYGGVRYELTEGGKWNPYVSFEGGAKMVDQIDATFTVPDVGVTLADVPVYEDDTVLFVSGYLGTAYSVTPNFEIGGEVGIGYQDSLSGDDSVLGLLGLGSINDEGDLLFLPARLFVSFRF